MTAVAPDKDQPILVLAGSLFDFKMFIRERCRSFADEDLYRYVHKARDVRGYTAPSYILWNFWSLNPNAFEILEELKAAGGVQVDGMKLL